MEVRKAYTRGQVLLVADRAMVVTPGGNNLGWGKLLADGHGVLATVHSKVSTVLSSL